MSEILIAIALLFVSGLIAAALGRYDRLALGVGTLGSAAACAIGLFGSVKALLEAQETAYRYLWTLPVGELHFAVDALSAFFLICIFLVSGLSVVYGGGYLKSYIGKQKVAPAVFWFSILVAAMALVAIARDGILFLIAWEAMSFASFFLVTFESDREDVRQAGISYLIASHLGVMFIFTLFVLLGGHSGNFNFNAFQATVGAEPARFASLCFLLAVVGFGAKAGFWPMHVWLPDAHPAAPSHVSAVMSGVMIKMGIYGLLRTLTFLGAPPLWWGTTLIIIGAVSGISGIIHALAQHDLKRLLAYSSVENMGVIVLGLGLGLVGQSLGNPAIAFLGYAGGLLHILNHGLFKSLLFMGAGSVLHATGTRAIDTLGGLFKKMPHTGLLFLIGAVAISGLPPLNGFVSEWMIYVGAFTGASTGTTPSALTALIVLPCLALIGGLAAACFVKVFGMVFLGEPRSEAPAKAHEMSLSMRAPMIAGAVICAGIGLWPTGAIALVRPAVSFIGNIPAPFSAVPESLLMIRWIALGFLGLVAVLFVLRKVLLGGREVTQSGTWGCGYAAPTARMQYTGSSFSDPLLIPFELVLPATEIAEKPQGCFPEKVTYKKHYGDMVVEKFLPPISRWIMAALAGFRIIQQGRLQLYFLYILVTLMILLVWQILGGGV